MAKTRSVTAHIPVELAVRVDEISGRLGRSKSWIVKQALSAWLDQEEKRSRLTREALADVDAGRVIDHQAVQAWAESLSSPAPISLNIEQLENLLGELYLVLGALDAPEAVLDQVIAALEGGPLPHESLLPFEPPLPSRT
jgi:predicted transcriptional regulator